MRKPTQTLLPANVFASVLADRKATAAADLGRFPQYDGSHTGPEWTLFRAKKEIKTKLGGRGDRGRARPREDRGARPGRADGRAGGLLLLRLEQGGHARRSARDGALVSRRVRGAWIRALRAAWKVARAIADGRKTLATERVAYETRRIFHAALHTTTSSRRAGR